MKLNLRKTTHNKFGLKPDFEITVHSRSFGKWKSDYKFI